MKKRLLFLASFLICLAMGTNAQVTSTDIIGSYTGNLDVFFDFGTLIPVGSKENVKVYTSLQENNKIKLTLKDFSIEVGGQEILVGDIEMTDVTVDAAGNVSAPENEMTHPELGYLPIKLTGGKMNSTNANLDIRVIWTNSESGMETPIVVNYKNGVKDPTTGISSANDATVEAIVMGDELIVSGANLSKCSVYALTGTLISTIQAQNNKVPLDNISNGIYLIHLVTDKGIITRKIVRN
ncbi:MAG: calycin-like domain-containing protein [Bacteroidales bacterium]